jgi:hypothetical protein
MSNLHLTPYLNVYRPQLQHSFVTVHLLFSSGSAKRSSTDQFFRRSLPVDALGSDLSLQLLSASLTVDSSNGFACAASARLWECLLETREHRVPYLLLRVAGMRMTMGSKVTALSLHEEVSSSDGEDALLRTQFWYLVANDVG